MAYSFQQLRDLWTSSGGPAEVADVMAAIGLAESAGEAGARNAQSGACGLWQIHPAQPGCQDPAQNARMAVEKYRSRGLGAWEAYTNGSYQQFLSGARGKVRGSGGTTKTGTGVVAGVQVDPFGIGQAIGDFAGRVGATAGTAGERFMAGGQVLAGLIVLGVAVGLLGWLWLTRTDSGRAVASGARRSAQAAATIAVVAPK